MQPSSKRQPVSSDKNHGAAYTAHATGVVVAVGGRDLNVRDQIERK